MTRLVEAGHPYQLPPSWGQDQNRRLIGEDRPVTPVAARLQPVVTFVEWLASRPFGRPIPLEEATRLEIAWNTALRRGRESTPPGPSA